MSASYVLYLDTAVSPSVLRRAVVGQPGFVEAPSWRSADGTPWLIGCGAVLIEAAGPGRHGPQGHEQAANIVAILDPNKQPGANGALLRLAGNLLQGCPGDAVLQYDTGPTILVRRGGTVWVDEDPFTRGHLFAGGFQPSAVLDLSAATGGTQPLKASA